MANLVLQIQRLLVVVGSYRSFDLMLPQGKEKLSVCVWHLPSYKRALEANGWNLPGID